MPNTKRKKPIWYSRMSHAKLDAMAAEFDQEFIADTFRPLTPAERRQWERMKRRGTPSAGKDETVVSVSIDRNLLRAADRLAKAKKLTRAKLVARGLRALLAAEGIQGAA